MDNTQSSIYQVWITPRLNSLVSGLTAIIVLASIFGLLAANIYLGLHLPRGLMTVIFIAVSVASSFIFSPKAGELTVSNVGFFVKSAKGEETSYPAGARVAINVRHLPKAGGYECRISLPDQGSGRFTVIFKNSIELIKFVDDAKARWPEGGPKQLTVTGALPKPVNLSPEMAERLQKWLPKRIGPLTITSLKPVSSQPPISASSAAVPAKPSVESYSAPPPSAEDPMTASRRGDILRVVVAVVLGVLVYGAYRYFVQQ